MFQQHEEFAVQLVNDVSSRFTGLRTTPEKQCQITLPCSTQESSSIELTPFAVEAKTTDDKQLFNTVHTVDELLTAYTQARQLKPFKKTWLMLVIMSVITRQNFWQQFLTMPANRLMMRMRAESLSLFQVWIFIQRSNLLNLY